MRGRGSDRSQAMGYAPIWGLLLRFSGPAIVSMMVTSSYNIVDAIFVGRLGPDALAALAVAFPLMMVFMALSMGTGMGAASLISRRLGAGEREGANRVAGATITLVILMGALMPAICLPNLESLLRLFGASGSVLPLARGYMSVLITFSVANFFSMVIGTIIRAEGNPVLASAGMIVSAVTNIILDPIIIFGLGPVPAMGVAGAAAATVIGRSVGSLIFLAYFLSKRTSFRFRPSYFLLDLQILIDIYRVGVASMARGAAGSVAQVLTNRIAASFGVIPLAIRGVLFRSASFAFMPCMGLGQGALPLIGYNFGARQKERVGEVVIKAGLAGLIWGVLCWVAVMLFSTQIMSIFNTDPQFLLEGSRALRIFALIFFGIGIQMLLSFFFQGIGQGLPSLVLASARQIVFFLPSLLILPRLFGLTGLWVAFPVADALSTVLSLVWTGVEFRRQGIRFRLHYD
jgi:putative MATE family efflux protein